MVRPHFFLLWILSATAFIQPLSASTVKQAGLETMIRLSGEVFVGRCTAVRPTQLSIRGGMVPATQYGFRVIASLKGTSTPSRVYRTLQLGWPHHPSVSTLKNIQRIPPWIDGMPEYQVGEEYLLMLTRPSRSGLSSPVGLQQSAFRATRNRFGERVWLNGLNNRGLLDDPTPNQRESQEILKLLDARGTASGLPYREFIELVRRLCNGR